MNVPDDSQEQNSSRNKLYVFLFVCSFLIYAFVTLYKLEEFPINFFSDEAVQTVDVQDLVAQNFHDHKGNFLPTYFPVAWNMNISLSVYLQVPGYLLFGKSIFVTRAAQAIVCLLTPIFICLILRHIFNVKWWWLGTLVLLAMPTWFLHSRTALECSLTAPLYAGFMWFYMLYRQGKTRYLYAAVFFAALTFYSRSVAQGLILFTALALFISDLPYHWKNRRTVLLGILLAGIFALPFYRFRLQYPEVIAKQFTMLESYVTQNRPASEKLEIFAEKYWRGLSPQYWFFSDDELVRHRLKGYGHIIPAFFIPFVIGLLVCLYKIKSSPHRLVLIALLASPITSALIEIMVGRIITYFVPACILIVFGIELVKNLLLRVVPADAFLAVGAFAGLSFVNISMLNDALTNGPKWFAEYTLYGMQWGAKQMFEEEIPAFQKANPESQVYLSPDWANGTEVFLGFFDLPRKIKLVSLHEFILHKTKFEDNAVFIVTPQEYSDAIKSKKFDPISVLKTVKYPDGNDGFYFLRLQYSADADKVFEEEKERRKVLKEATVKVQGEDTSVKFSTTDMGPIENLFDGNEGTIIRGMEANPFVVLMTFPSARKISSIECVISNSAYVATFAMFNEQNEKVLEATLPSMADKPSHAVRQLSPAAEKIKSLRFEISNPTIATGDPANMHIAEIQVK